MHLEFHFVVSCIAYYYVEAETMSHTIFIELILWATKSQFHNSGLAGKPSVHCLLEAGKNQSPLCEVGIEKSLFQNLLGPVHSAVNNILTYPKRIYCTLLCGRSHAFLCSH